MLQFNLMWLLVRCSDRGSDIQKPWLKVTRRVREQESGRLLTDVLEIALDATTHVDEIARLDIKLLSAEPCS